MGFYWPPNAPCEYTVSAYIEAYKTIGYIPCADDSLEQGFEKIALYALNGAPTHAARQLENGKWSSKLGRGEDIEHMLDGLTGNFYGVVVQFLKRPIT